MTDTESQTLTHWKSAGLVWALAAVFSLVVGIFVSTELRFSVLSVGGALSVACSFFVHMIGGRSDGFINRVAASVAGAFVIFALASIVFAVIAIIER